MRPKKSGQNFFVTVRRDHNDWQGEIVWLNKRKEEKFRSSLEFIKLLDSALKTEEKPEDNS
ncbi:MAG: hypothetical protein PUF83_04870 [Intestinibaculum porci]|uniref:hypothetical protein n=1 Tax=Intestinibaculum porci TaxID=2487118 RepID=UPI00240A2661|nr:hypothetical protein [Intestinibaculum porci]MDD6422382.1 hypothetical protein [Intestinibaculum porci]